ncbi:hypothetical protein BDZ97DRAFT_1911418 [Flammula alnicola]|nr:hypothetical protein BDZ97DRAFT_1911418 [Flammula alnicola]
MPSVSSKRLYLRGLCKDVTEEDLSKAILILLRENLRSKTASQLVLWSPSLGFESEKDALLVLETYKNQPLLGKRVIVQFAHPLRKDMPSVSSSNSSPKSRPSAYKASYIRHPVVVLDLPRTSDGRNSKILGDCPACWWPTVTSTRPRKDEDAQHAVRSLDGKRLRGRKVRVVDHEEYRESQSFVRERNRSRSRSPERRSTFDGYKRHVENPSVVSPILRLADRSGWRTVTTIQIVDTRHSPHIPRTPILSERNTPAGRMLIAKAPIISIGSPLGQVLIMSTTKGMNIVDCIRTKASMIKETQSATHGITCTISGA